MNLRLANAPVEFDIVVENNQVEETFGFSCGYFDARIIEPEVWRYIECYF